MKSSGSLDLARLPGLSLAELRALWTEHIGRSTAPAQKRLLIRELAWRIQAREQGGPDAATRKLLAAAMRDAVRRAKSSARAGNCRGVDSGSQVADPTISPGTPPPSPSRRRVGRKAPAPLAPATRLIRVWRGVRHEVHVLEGGEFRYRNRSFKSLSEIAREITGTRWSGPRFFGISTRSESEL